MTTQECELLELNRKLLDYVAVGGDANWEEYKKLIVDDLSSDDLSSFEPESIGTFMRGLGFHRFGFNMLPVFQLGKHTEGDDAPPPSIDDTDAYHKYYHYNTELTSPHVRIMGDVGVVTYIRVDQYLFPPANIPTVRSTEETRVWQKQQGNWKLVHFHRSKPGTAPAL